MVLTFTGSRSIKKEKDICWRLHRAIEMFIEKGFDTFNCGMAISSDTYFAQSVLKHKEKYSHIKLIAYIPHLNQDKLWTQKDKDTYKEILEKADEVIQVTDSEYTTYSLHLRNDKMLENCSQVLALWDGSKSGGTWSTIQKAIDRENVKEIYIIKE